MNNYKNNFAFIDAQNVYLSIKSEGWILDWRKFRIYLSDKYKIKTAYFFLGYLPENHKFYKFLIDSGYKIIFKEVVVTCEKIKANVDAELVLHSMIEYRNYDKAVLISNDGDFACLVNYLSEQNKLHTVLAPSFNKCSRLLKKAAKGRINSISSLKYQLKK